MQVQLAAARTQAAAAAPAVPAGLMEGEDEEDDDDEDLPQVRGGGEGVAWRVCFVWVLGAWREGSGWGANGGNRVYADKKTFLVRWPGSVYHSWILDPHAPAHRSRWRSCWTTWRDWRWIQMRMGRRRIRRRGKPAGPAQGIWTWTKT